MYWDYTENKIYRYIHTHTYNNVRESEIPQETDRDSTGDLILRSSGMKTRSRLLK